MYVPNKASTTRAKRVGTYFKVGAVVEPLHIQGPWVENICVHEREILHAQRPAEEDGASIGVCFRPLEE